MAAIPDREEKMLETALDIAINRLQDLKNSLAAFIFRLETESDNLKWPSMLDSFALVSGQINNMMKVLRNDKTPALRKRVLLPLMLSPDRDEELARLTEGRVQAFNHEMVPDYMRTKAEPEVEAREQQLIMRAANISQDAGHKQIASVNKIVTNVLEIVRTTREEWETESGQRSNASQTSSQSDTHTLIAAITLGKGLKDVGPQKVGPAQSSVPTISPNVAPQPGLRSGPGKAPSAIKTNIKSASSNLPYNR